MRYLPYVVCLLVCNCFTWFLYYIPTRAGIYGRGYFGFRYNIFFIPMWLITFLFLFYECYQMLSTISDEKKRKLMRKAYQSIMILAAFGYCIYGSHQIRKHWEKSDVRGCVQAWYEEDGFETYTFVESGQASTFSYYYEHDNRYQTSFDEKVIREVSATVENEVVEEQNKVQYYAYVENMNQRFGENWPDQVYCFVGNIDDNPLIEVFTNQGYQIREVYKTTSQLYYLYK